MGLLIALNILNCNLQALMSDDYVNVTGISDNKRLGNITSTFPKTNEEKADRSLDPNEQIVYSLFTPTDSQLRAWIKYKSRTWQDESYILFIICCIFNCCFVFIAQSTQVRLELVLKRRDHDHKLCETNSIQMFGSITSSHNDTRQTTALTKTNRRAGVERQAGRGAEKVCWTTRQQPLKSWRVHGASCSALTRVLETVFELSIRYLTLLLWGLCAFHGAWKKQSKRALECVCVRACVCVSMWRVWDEGRKCQKWAGESKVKHDETRFGSLFFLSPLLFTWLY